MGSPYNHLMVQVANKMEADGLSPDVLPCCAPTRVTNPASPPLTPSGVVIQMSPLHIIHIKEPGLYASGQIDNMIVESCGC